MKKIVTTCLVLIKCCLAIAQTTYTITIRDCVYNSYGDHYYPIIKERVKVIDARTKQKIQHQYARRPESFKITTKSSIVSITYPTIYGQLVDTVLSLKPSIKNYFICQGKFIDYPVETTVDKTLNAGQVWEINYIHYGCFSIEEYASVIEKKGERLHITTYRDGKIASEGEFSSTYLNRLVRFEKQLLLMHWPNGLCSGLSVYVIKSPYGSYEVRDQTCAWSESQVLWLDIWSRY